MEALIENPEIGEQRFGEAVQIADTTGDLTRIALNAGGIVDHASSVARQVAGLGSILRGGIKR